MESPKGPRSLQISAAKSAPSACTDCRRYPRTAPEDLDVLTAIHVRNVRLFKGDWTFDLGPLTVICGTNSAGKSTLLKVPLLLQQSESLTGDSYESDGALRLQGPRLDLGEFSGHSFRTKTKISRCISGWNLKTHSGQLDYGSSLAEADRDRRRQVG